MSKKTVKQFAIYSRKSKFTGKGESIENQVEMCRQFIGLHYGKDAALAAKVYEDEGFSGGNLDRPKFKEMMEATCKSHIDGIVVYRLDRISRNIGDFANLIQDFGDRGIEFISISEQFNTNSPIGRAMMYIASIFSQLERETIAERIRDNMHELAKTGRWLGGVTPTGYESEGVTSVTIDGKTKKAYRLKTIPQERELVLLIYEKFLETGSITKTDEFLLTNHFKTKNNKPFSRFAIKGILSNPVYAIADEDTYNYLIDNEISLFCDKAEFDGSKGVMVYNRTLQRKGKAHQIKPTNEWIAAIGKHDGFISGAKWVQTQNLLLRNKSKSYRRPRSNVALLSGLLFCSDCNSHMRPKLSARLNARGETIYSYVCTTKERSRSQECTIKTVNGNTLDAAVINVIKGLAQNKDEIVKQLENVKKSLTSYNTGYSDTIAGIKTKIENEEKEIASLALALAKASGSVAEKYVLDSIQEHHEQIQRLQSQMQQLEGLISKNKLDNLEFDLIRQMLSSFEKNVDAYTVEEKRAAIRTFVRRIIWDGQQIHMYLFNNDEELDLSLSYEEQTFTTNDEPLCENSERDTYAFQGKEKACK